MPIMGLVNVLEVLIWHLWRQYCGWNRIKSNKADWWCIGFDKVSWIL